MKALKLTLYVCAFSMILSACGKSSGGGSSAEGDKSNLDFYLSDGSCFRASDNATVSMSNCDDLKFFIQDGQCVRESDDRDVAIGNCTSNTFYAGRNACYDRDGDSVAASNCDEDNNGSSTSGRRRVCEGPHLSFDRSNIYEVDCSTSTGNCVGFPLFSIEDQLFVDCI